MKQIKALIDAIAIIIFRKAAITYEIQDEANHTVTDTFYLRINELLDNGNINEAEDLLYETIVPNDMNHLLLAVDFYQRLNEISDDELERCGFSRDEINDGLAEVMKIFGIGYLS